MNLEVNVQTIVAVFSAFFGAGSGWKFAEPFAKRAFDHWLQGAERAEQAKIDSDKAKREDEQRTLSALEKHAALQERVVGVLERIDERQDAVEQRLQRIERHLRVPLSVSKMAAVQAPGPPTPRATITGEHAPITAEQAATTVPESRKG